MLLAVIDQLLIFLDQALVSLLPDLTSFISRILLSPGHIQIHAAVLQTATLTVITFASRNDALPSLRILAQNLLIVISSDGMR
jgi:hypothetical protein